MNTDYRNVRVIGVVGVIVMALMLTASFRLSTLGNLVAGGGTHYSAEFTDAAGIAPGDPVRIAGIAVGKVDSVRVVRDHTVVDYTVKHAPHLGSETGAALSLDTLLGQNSLVLTPAGAGTLGKGATIPLRRTSTPFGVTNALLGTARTLAPINTTELATALRTVASAIDPGAPDVRTAATGLSGLAKAVGDRDAEVQDLFAQTEQIAATLSDRRQDITTLIQNSGLVVQTLDRRQQVIRELLSTTSDLARTVTAIISENQGRITPALRHLKTVLGVLVANQANLDESLRLLAPYLRYFTNLTGNGRWFDGTFAGLVPLDLNTLGKKTSVGTK
ncbi:MAG TPA: MCE family protein [Marmoricola sp.]|nr:MCE family protein [Marmoricola sp.]